MASPALNVALTLMHIVRIVAEGLFVTTPKERRRAARIERRRLRREAVAREDARREASGVGMWKGRKRVAAA